MSKTRIVDAFEVILLLAFDKFSFQANIYLFKVAIERQEKGIKYVQSEQLKNQNDVNDIVLLFLLLTLNIFHTFF